jgi:hypothetical protein
VPPGDHVEIVENVEHADSFMPMSSGMFDYVCESAKSHIQQNSSESDYSDDDLDFVPGASGRMSGSVYQVPGEATDASHLQQFQACVKNCEIEEALLEAVCGNVDKNEVDDKSLNDVTELHL